MNENGTVGFDYAKLVADALRGVVRDVLRAVASDGLVGEQHLFFSFRTSTAGLDLPAHLRKQFPEEMTIVLQNQFWGLVVADDAFSVQLRFGGKLERLTVPFAALVAFADPSVPFGLRFEADGKAERDGEASSPAKAPPEPPASGHPRGTGDSKVVAFRRSRKKTARPGSDS